MKSFAILALSAVALAAPLREKRDVVYETVVKEVCETLYTTTTVWVDPTPAPSNAPIGGFYQKPHSPSSSSSAVPSSVPAPAAAALAPSAAPEAPFVPPTVPSTSVAPYVPPAAPTTPVAPAPAPVAPSPSTYVPPAAPSPSTPVPPAAPSPSSSGGSGSTSSGQGDHTGDITYYDVSVGTGSCGTTASNSDAVVALSHLDMNNGANPNANPLCGKTINIYYNGNVHQARIFDTCPTCAEGSLDLSPSLFQAVAPNGDGRVHGVSWSLA